jgi:uncharacterized protein YciI
MGKRLFAVLNTRGPRWNHGRPMEEQEGWRAHADFMNGLQADGFVVLGGPLAGTDDVLLIVRAGDEAEVDARLAPDVWVVNGLLSRHWIRPLSLRLGSLGGP